MCGAENLAQLLTRKILGGGESTDKSVVRKCFSGWQLCLPPPSLSHPVLWTLVTFEHL